MSLFSWLKSDANNEEKAITKLVKISDGLGEYAQFSNVPEKGKEMLNAIQKIESKFVNSLNPKLFYNLAISYRNFTTWYIRGDNRKIYLQKVISYLNKAIDLNPNDYVAKSELGSILIEKSLIRNLNEGIRLLEELKNSGNLSEIDSISLNKAYRMTGKSEKLATLDLSTMPITPGFFREERKKYRTLIKKFKKSKDDKELKQTLNDYYNLAIFVSALYGNQDCNRVVIGYLYDIAKILQKRIAKRINFSYPQHGSIKNGNFISKNDYKTFETIFGETEKEIDPLRMFQPDFDASYQEFENQRKNQFSIGYHPMGREQREMLKRIRYGS